MLQCHIISASSTGALETEVNAWLAIQDDNITVSYITTTEGDISSSEIKIYIFYSNDWARAPQV